MSIEREYGEVARVYDGDYEFRRTPSGDVAFYVEEARRSGGPVAEFGCGTGRVLVPTAEAGVEIDGVDLSPDMLAAARGKLAGRNLPATLHAGDVRTHDLGRTYALVTLPFRVLAHLHSVADQERAFANLRRHLAPDGRLVFDHYHPHSAYLTDPVEERLELEYDLDGRKVRRFMSSQPDRAAQTNEITLRWEIEGEEPFTTRFAMRYFYRFEVEHLLARCGLAVEALYGDFDRSPFRHDSKEMIFVARRT